MSTLAQQIPEQEDGSIVVGADNRKLSRHDLQKTGVAPNISPSMRIAVRLHNPLDVVRAMAALDGQVAAILLLSHTVSQETALALAHSAGCTILVQDEAPETESTIKSLSLSDVLGSNRLHSPVQTIWMLTTSGTTGFPKIVPHTLRSLSQSVYRFPVTVRPVWGLLYDPTRFAGLQVVLQALIGGGQLITGDPLASLADQIAALAKHNCSHLSATPTLWRRILMVPHCQDLPLKQITLGGEIVEQPTLTMLRTTFPQARLSHIYASTEAGVGFSVTDGLAGFPLEYLDKTPGNVRISIRNEVLWLQPSISALRPGSPNVEVDEEGYICSGDRVAVRGGRIFFLGRENGVINIGGVKVHPEMVESVIQSVPGVLLVQVSAKRSPVTGSLVLAEVQLEAGCDPDKARKSILAACRERLEREAVPAIIRFVDGFRTNAAGKLLRTGVTA